eukprot:955713-Amphidinium_carterae.2
MIRASHGSDLLFGKILARALGAMSCKYIEDADSNSSNNRMLHLSYLMGVPRNQELSQMLR